MLAVGIQMLWTFHRSWLVNIIIIIDDHSHFKEGEETPDLFQGASAAIMGEKLQQ